jgi:hypothetical protein
MGLPVTSFEVAFFNKESPRATAASSLVDAIWLELDQSSRGACTKHEATKKSCAMILNTILNLKK